MKLYAVFDRHIDCYVNFCPEPVSVGSFRKAAVDNAKAALARLDRLQKFNEERFSLVTRDSNDAEK